MRSASRPSRPRLPSRRSTRASPLPRKKTMIPEEEKDISLAAGRWSSAAMRRAHVVLSGEGLQSQLERVADRIARAAGRDRSRSKMYVLSTTQRETPGVAPNGDVFVCSGPPRPTGQRRPDRGGPRARAGPSLSGRLSESHAGARGLRRTSRQAVSFVVGLVGAVAGPLIAGPAGAGSG